MPRAIKWLRPGMHAQPLELAAGPKVVELNDQHAHLEIDEGVDLRFGDMLGFGVSHPCTTFEKWRNLQLVDEDYRIVQTYRTYF